MLAGAAGDLPADLFALCPPETPRRGWALGLETQHQATWRHPQSAVCLLSVEPDAADLRVRLPWSAILRDALAVGGCIVHAGLAALAGRGFLFLARAGGGKTTALRRLPQPWAVLADDATLVWQQGSAWMASPLPTWSWILGGAAARPDLLPWRLAEAVRLERAIVLRKSDRLSLVACAPSVAVTELYLAAAEYPAVFQLRHTVTRELFAFAVAVARGLPAVALELRPGDEYWRLLDDGAA